MIIKRCTKLGVIAESSLCRFCQTRKYATPATMKAWQAYEYGGPEQLTLSTTAIVPAMVKPNDILVEVHAASINPMDTDMLAGYGSQTFSNVQKLSGLSSQFPITLGRDFSGVVVDKARGVSSKVLKPGDEVWGVTSPLVRSTGSHAEYVIASSTEIITKPPSLSHIEAASFPYVVCTAWSAITKSAGLTHKNSTGKRTLILGASGGVGTFAVQLLKAWGAEIVTTCGTDSVDMVSNLGADVVIDYKTADVKKELSKINQFDFILDCVKDNPIPVSFWMSILKSNCNASYVTLNSPLLRNNDQMGFPFGFAKSALDFGPDALRYKAQGKNLGWGLFYPSTSALKHVADLIEKGQMRPLIEQVYTFDQVPEGFRKVSARQGKGKSVINVKSSNE